MEPGDEALMVRCCRIQNVIARLDRATQYSGDSSEKSRSRGVLNWITRFRG
jgi:hypothetical protein